MQEVRERKDRFSSLSGLPIAHLYTKDDLKDWEPERDLGEPGEFPYTRGIHPTMYRSRLWTMRQFAGFGTASDTNARFKYLLDQGQTGLSVAFDMPTLAAGLRVEADLRNEKINYKVREHSLAHVPAMLVVGRREADDGTVAVRRLGSKKQEILALDDAVGQLSAEAVSPAAN